MKIDSAVLYEDGRARAAAEELRLIECAAEQLRTIGRIQSHGALLALDEPSGVVVVASENVEHWLGRPLAESGSDSLLWAVAHAVAIDPVRVDLEGIPFDAVVHRGTDPLIIELEPVAPDLAYVRTGVVTAIQRISSMSDPDELRVLAAAEIKAITGFDRVMCYEFHEDGHGRIVADEREPDMEPYLGLRFPASDIPSQARALYLRKRSRVIAHTEDPGLALKTSIVDGPPLDLAESELRGVSPHHLQFMRNMGQVSTVSFAIVVDGRMVGMFTCAHRTPRRLPVLLRRALEVLATQVGTQLSAAEQIRELRRRLEARERRVAIVAPLYGPADIAGALLSGQRSVLEVVPADGVLLQHGDTVRTAGAVPPPSVLLDVVDQLEPGGLVWEALPIDRPELAVEIAGVAGLLIVPFGEDGSRLVFVRGEVSRDIDWLGDQRAANRDDTFSPRRSFSAWRESVTGRSLPWGDHAQDAFALGEEIRAALIARSQAELAELAVRDALTGLHNRRFLDDRLDALLQGAHARVAVIFFDLDHFKTVNDTRGHDVGDAVLAAVGKRLAGVARASDMVVRLGGDEFVIVCVGATAVDAELVAARAVAAVAEPIAVDDATIAITMSAGVVVAGATTTASALLARADAAMYRSKQAGGGRASV